MIIEKIAKKVGRWYLEGLADKKNFSYQEKFFFTPSWRGEGTRSIRELNTVFRMYGFLPSETWDLGFTMAALLYERVKYYADAVANTIVDAEAPEILFEGKLYTMNQVIAILLEGLENYLTDEASKTSRDEIRVVWSLWAVAQEHFWW